MGVVARRPARPALAAGAVVGEEDDDRVVPLAHLLQRGPQSAEVLVDPVDHRRVDSHVAGVQPLFGGGQLVPRQDVGSFPGVARRQRCPRRDDPQRQLTGVTAGADLVPANGVDVVVAGDVLRHRHQWGVRRRMGEVQEERLGRARCLAFADHRDRPGGELVGQVEVVRVAVDVDLMVVLDQPVRLVEVGERVEDPEESVEAALQWPRMHRAVGGDIGVAAQVPLAGHHRRVAGGAQDLRRGGDVVGEFAAIAGEPGVVLGDVADPGRVGVDSGEQRGPGRRAHRVDVEVGEAHPLGRQAVDLGGLDLAAEASDVAEADVVDEDEDDVRAPRRRFWSRRPGRLGASHRRPDRALEPGVRAASIPHPAESNGQSDHQVSRRAGDGPGAARSPDRRLRPAIGRGSQRRR